MLALITSQAEQVQETLNRKLYELVGKLYNLGFTSERFDKIDDYQKQVALVPVSAKTGTGIAELLMVVTGLAQRFLEDSLEVHTEGPGKGTILEVKEEKGLGTTLDVILYDGSLKVDDTLVIGGIEEALVTKVKALFEPDSSKGKSGYTSVKAVHAAVGVKIIAPDIKNVVAGMPLVVAHDNIELIKEKIQEEIHEVLLETDREGVVVKADSLGSLEALTSLLKEKGIAIKKARIGDITKKDITDAAAEKNSLNQVILGFNIKNSESEQVKIISRDIIYTIIDDFEAWQEEEKHRLEAQELHDVPKPCKIMFMRGYIFRQSNPAVIGVEVLEGTLTRVALLKADGSKAGEIKDIQEEGKSVATVHKNKQVAVSLPHITVDRQIKEGDILYSDIGEEDFRKLKKLKKYLNRSELAALKEIAEIKRKEHALWGV